MNYCNDEIHEELILLGRVCCDFCDERIIECSVKNVSCCENQNLINDNGEIVCSKCGVVDGYHIAE